MDHVDELFAAMDVNGDGKVTKTEFLDFLVEHKPKDGPWTSTAKLQAHFGLHLYSTVDLPTFTKAFTLAKSEGLEPETFNYRFKVPPSRFPALHPFPLSGPPPPNPFAPPTSSPSSGLESHGKRQSPKE